MVGEAEIAELRSRGLQFDEYDLPDYKTANGIPEIEGYRGAWFKDSADNSWLVPSVSSSG